MSSYRISFCPSCKGFKQLAKTYGGVESKYCNMCEQSRMKFYKEDWKVYCRLIACYMSLDGVDKEDMLFAIKHGRIDNITRPIFDRFDFQIDWRRAFICKARNEVLMMIADAITNTETKLQNERQVMLSNVNNTLCNLPTDILAYVIKPYVSEEPTKKELTLMIKEEFNKIFRKHMKALTE